MANKKIEKALNKQFNAELYSAYLYWAMSAWFEQQNLPGFAHWLEMQAFEELQHSHKFYKYVVETDGTPDFDAVAKPPVKWDSPLEAFEEVLKHEKDVTSKVHKLMALAREENDYPTENFLQWFVSEQVEEEANAKQVVERLKMVGDGPQGMFMMDRHMAARQQG